MATLDLAKVEWNLTGWRPYQWQAVKMLETGSFDAADVPTIPARVPGSVQQALLEAGVLPDWDAGTNSRLWEWVEHRHWQFRTTLPGSALTPGRPAVLEAPGLDYGGWIFLDGVEVGRFEGALMSHRFDLTPFVTDRSEHVLDILFDEPPHEYGFCGFTSRSRVFKPRYTYGWDWCPRFVPIGVWDRLTLLTGADALLRVERVRTALDADNRRGTVDVAVALDEGWRDDGVRSIEVTLADDDGRACASSVLEPEQDALQTTLGPLDVEPWWPNGLGAAKCYTLTIRALDGEGRARAQRTRTVGFRRIEWQACEGAPDGAEPWICVVNGRPVFLQGVNWTPIRMAYMDTSKKEYQRAVGLYRDMGCNCLRVWGGAILETESFYEACDRAGLLVWQEFPLSSSSMDNWPPEDETAIARLAEIARTYIARRHHHPSLFVWCGGNELQGDAEGNKFGQGRPVGYDHPCIAALAEVVRQHDPDRRFLPTSASGPREFADEAEYGLGVHHDIHGPWGLLPGQSKEGWRRYWEKDDALFRSEVGAPSASRVELIRAYSAGLPVWPPEGPYWKHTSKWWSQWDRYREALADLPEEEALAAYVEATRRDQAELLTIAARACKGRFPRCGGFLIWMGHDCFPCLANNSLIEIDLTVKPAYAALQAVFLGEAHNKEVSE